MASALAHLAVIPLAAHHECTALVRALAATLCAVCPRFWAESSSAEMCWVPGMYVRIRWGGAGLHTKESVDSL